MSVAQAVYTYVKSIELYKGLEIEDSLRQQEINNLISEYDLQRRLELQFNSIIKDITTQKDEEKNTLISTITNLEKTNSKLSSDLEKTEKQVQSTNHIIPEKKSLEKQITDLKNQLDKVKSANERVEKDKLNLQSTEKALKNELTDVKSQLHKQKVATEKETREKDKLKSQFTNQKSVLESKVESLKSKLDKANKQSTSISISNSSRLSPTKSITSNILDSPSAPPTFSPGKRRTGVPSRTASSLLKASSDLNSNKRSTINAPQFSLPKVSLSGGLAKSNNSDIVESTSNSNNDITRTDTTDTINNTFINKPEIKHPSPSPSPIPAADERNDNPVPSFTQPTTITNDLTIQPTIKTTIKRKPRPSLQNETSFTATTKDGKKKISLFDSDDEDVEPTTTTTTTTTDTKSKRKRKLKTNVNLIDEDNPDNPDSHFKRITPNTTLSSNIFNKEISPVKSRKIFRIS